MRRFLCALFVLSLAALSARAEDDVYVRGKKKIKGYVAEETAQGVKLKGVKKIIPAENIIDIEYELLPFAVRTGQYRPARKAEEDSNDPAKEAKRPENLAKALQGYEASLKDLKEGQKFAERNLEYKIAILYARKAREDGAPAEAALSRLAAFKTKHPDSWQIVSALQTLAQLQIERKMYAEAEESYKDLAKANVPEEVRQEAELSAAQVGLRAGKHAEAQAKLEALIAKLPKDSPFVGRARIAQAECLVAANKTDQARGILGDIIKNTSESSLKAAAYNALGESYFKAKQFAAARWEFLWVDVVYNQNRAEHARALYHLMLIFDQLGQTDRSQECRETLLNERQFAGLEYQRLAREKK